jgi:uncharacterized protein with von Willebrand factor type A (vWA) domain
LNDPDAELDVEIGPQISGFVRSLRKEGFDLGPGATLDLHRLISDRLPERNRRGLHAPLVGEWCDAMRSLLCHDHAEWQQFPELFERYWLPMQWAENAPLSAEEQIDPRLRKTERRAATTGFAGSSEHFDADGGAGTGAGRQNTLSRTDFGFLLDARARRETERLAERMARTLPQRVVRKKRIARRGGQLHLRRTLRSSFRTGGLPLHPRYSVPRRETPKLVLIQDISHSMARYNPMFMRFSRGLLRVALRAEAFCFHTRMYRVTDLYRERDAITVKKRLDGMSHLWLGGTRIAESLAEFNRDYARDCIDRATIVVLMSDGYDADEPDELAQELARLRQRAKKLVWLNPALDRPGLADPDTPEVVLAQIDRLLPASSLEGLSRAVEALARG